TSATCSGDSNLLTRKICVPPATPPRARSPPKTIWGRLRFTLDREGPVELEGVEALWLSAMGLNGSAKIPEKPRAISLTLHEVRWIPHRSFNDDVANRLPI